MPFLSYLDQKNKTKQNKTKQKQKKKKQTKKKNTTTTTENDDNFEIAHETCKYLIMGVYSTPFKKCTVCKTFKLIVQCCILNEPYFAKYTRR